MKKHYPKNLEKKWQKFWDKENIYKFDPKHKGRIFSIDTPPPTVSGKMHIGHAFSYTHMDIIARYHRMKGENIFYPFGTDDNGLPTEKLVEKENKVKIFNMERDKFIKLCQKTIKKIRPRFTQGWKDIGLSCDFTLDYSTISKDVQKLSQKFFIELYKKKRVYRKESPTLWCPYCQTAIAQAELEDKEKESTFDNIIFRLDNGKKITIATTRPELLPSCVAIFIHPEDERYKNIAGEKAIVPIFRQKVPILVDDRVNPKKGTGVVMCCTFGDTTDIEWYRQYNLPIRTSIDKMGIMLREAKRYQGLKIQEARQKIIDDLKKQGLLSDQKKIKHIVNVHERCCTEVEIINTTQWFIKYLYFKKDFLKMAKTIKWHPNYMYRRYENWIEGLKWDWCISRQRYFGIPFPVWYCQKCGKVKIAEDSQLPIDPLRSKPKTLCSCGNNKFIPEKDVLDTWATSSLTPQIAIELVEDINMKKKLFPMSLRPQAHDNINFWLSYTLARSKLHSNKIPWKTAMISGFVLDPKGEKMSKSKGNVVEPQEIIQEYGADALRHWTAKAGLGEDLRWNEEEIRIGKRTCTKLWNAARFCSIHIENFKKKQKINFRKLELEAEDKWILHLLQTTIRDYDNLFRKYKFKKAREVIDNFFWKKFCDNYLEIVKPRIYGENASNDSKEVARFTLYTSLLSILKLYAPFIPFITEELFQIYFRTREKEKSIHQGLLPEINPKLLNPEAKRNFDNVINIISFVRKYRSEKKISQKKELSKILIQTEDKGIEKYSKLLRRVLNVKSIEFKIKDDKKFLLNIE